jgi:hypothetical protein
MLRGSRRLAKLRRSLMLWQARRSGEALKNIARLWKRRSSFSSRRRK